MTDYFKEPGLYTDQINPFPFGDGVTWPYLKESGFKWASFQCYNSQLFAGTKEYDLAAVKAHGFENVGVWGVIYSQADYYNGGKQIGMSAKKQGAQHVIIDAEECHKNTRDLSKGAEIIKGLRDGGWTGAVDLSTLGSPSNPMINDFAMDTKSFTDTGGSIQPQDYCNDYAEYTPKNSSLYWPRVGVPKNLINHTIGLYPGKLGKITGLQWVDLLKQAGVGRNFSVYQVQDTTKKDFDALAAYLKELSTTPVAYNSTMAKADMLFAAQKWLNGQEPNLQLFSRIRQARRILLTTDPQWSTLSSEVKTLL